MKQILQTQVGDNQASRLSWILPKNLDTLAGLLSPSLQGENLLQTNTPTPLYQAFLAGSHAQELTDYGLTGAKPKLFHQRQLSSHNRRVWGLALCPTCAMEDRRRVGVHIVRRTHLLPSLSVCHKHGEPLLEACRSCAWGHRHTHMPLIDARQCLCGAGLRPRYNAISSREQESDQRLGRVMKNLLTTDFSQKTSTDLAVQLQERANEHGLIHLRNRGYLLREFLCDTLGPTFLQRHGISIGSDPRGGTFYQRLRAGEPVGNHVVGSVLTLAFLGDAFCTTGARRHPLEDSAIQQAKVPPARVRRNYVAHADEHGVVLLHAKTLTKSEFTLHCRGLLASLMARFPEASRTIIKGKLRSNVWEWLVVHDADHLNRMLPKPTNATPSRHPDKAVAAAMRFDKSLSAHMKSMHKILWAAQGIRQFPISARLLTEGHPQASIIRWDSDSLPLSRAARLELEETAPAFARRTLSWLWVEEGRHENLDSARIAATEVADGDLRRELQYARKRQRRRRNETT